jgi:class 3 adenylate cyclase/tetratricopeptide (TPR) repeat protein
LEGGRKQVTVLFADLKGSMELLADRDPEEARKLLDPVVEHMMEAVHRYEGTVNQVMGDGIMALFGAPLAHEDHAVRACYAALRMQELVKLYADGVFRSHGLSVRIRIGLNSGDVVVRAIGSDLHMDYTAVGQTTHLATRMEQLADPGTTLLTATTLELAEGYLEVKSRGPVPVKGLAEPVVVYELAGTGAVRSRLRASVARGLSRFVGRDDELVQLRQALERSRTGRGQVVVVVGEPGVGKSRLYWEFIHSHRTSGWLILESGSVSYGKATPYLPVIDLLKRYFQIEERDDRRKVRERVTGKVLSLDRQLEPSLPALLALLDVAPDNREWSRLEPSQKRHRTLESVKHLLLRECQVQPVMTVFEDLHWIDGETQALLDSLVESLPTAALLVLVNYRPEYQHTWGSKTYYRQLRLDPLPADSAVDMLDGLLGTDPSTTSLKRLLIERTEGNALFLEESVRTLVESKALVGERGAYRMAHEAPAALQIPATVQAIIAARIDRLPPEDKRLLQAASVVGKDVPFVVLQAIADLSEDQCRRGLTRLQAAEFVYEAKLFPDLEYTFKHALTHEVTYGGLLHDRRRSLHVRILNALEHVYQERLTEHVERLGYHAARGEEWEKAFAYLRQAGEKAADKTALREAETTLEQAVSIADRLPHRPEILERSVDLRMAFRAVLFALGEFPKMRHNQERLLALAEELGDRIRLGMVINRQAHYHCIVSGELSEALEWVRRAMAIAEASEAPGLLGLTRYTLGQVHHSRGDQQEAIVVLQAAIRDLQGNLEGERLGMAAPVSLFARVWLAFSLAEVGRFPDGLAVAHQATEQAQAIDQGYGLYHGFWARAAVHLGRGEHEQAVEAATRVRRIYLETSAFSDNAGGLLGYAHVLAGRPAEAIALLEEVVGSERLRNAFNGHRDIISLAEAYLLDQRLDDALAAGRSALDILRSAQARGREGHVLRVLGDVYAARDDAGQAQATYREALAIAVVLAMRPLAAHCHLGLGKLHLRTDKREQAHEHLATATTMYREMGMTYWLEKAEAEMAT